MDHTQSHGQAAPQSASSATPCPGCETVDHCRRNGCVPITTTRPPELLRPLATPSLRAAQPAAEPVAHVPHVVAPHPELQNALFCYAAGDDGAAAVLIRGWSALVAQVEGEVARGDTPWAELLADLDGWTRDDRGVPYNYSESFEDGYMAIYRISEPAAQPARAGGDALSAGVKAAADWIAQRRADFIEAHGHTDPSTGTLEFGRGAHAEAKAEYVGELEEIEEGVRALASQPCSKPLEGWQCTRAAGHEGPCAALAAAPQPAPAERPSTAMVPSAAYERHLSEGKRKLRPGEPVPPSGPQTPWCKSCGGCYEWGGNGLLHHAGCNRNPGQSACWYEPAGGAVPAIYVNAEQLAAHKDPEDAEPFGRYLPARKTRAGKFMLPLYTGAPAAVERDAMDESERAELARLRALVNTPTLHSFRDGVVLEAVHQRERWGSSHDAGKAPADWFWLVGYLAGKALHAQTSGNTEKALHHTISTAAALANWHAAIAGDNTAMRPGIDPSAHGIGSSKEGGETAQ